MPIHKVFPRKSKKNVKASTLHVSCKLPGEPISKGLLMSVIRGGFRRLLVKTVLKLSVANFIRAQHCV